MKQSILVKEIAAKTHSAVDLSLYCVFVAESSRPLNSDRNLNTLQIKMCYSEKGNSNLDLHILVLDFVHFQAKNRSRKKFTFNKLLKMTNHGLKIKFMNHNFQI